MPEWLEQLAWAAAFIFLMLIIWKCLDYIRRQK